jgi:GDP-L-fucose synthase
MKDECDTRNSSAADLKLIMETNRLPGRPHSGFATPLLFDLRGKRVFVAGHKGMMGSAIVRRLAQESVELLVAERGELDLTDQRETEDWLSRTKPDAIFMAAAMVGGIYANITYPAEFISNNLAIALNVVRAAHKTGVRKLLMLGSSCIYPKNAKQPMSEDQLLTGPLEPTNKPYAIAKIAAIKLCEAYRKQHGRDFVSVMPTNLYGLNDNYHPQNSHVPAALIRRFHEAKLAAAPTVKVWGSGAPKREFLFADDAADACVLIMKHYSDIGFLNIGTGEDITIADFAKCVADVVGYQGRILFDTSYPDGAPQKLLDVSKIESLGWRHQTKLHEGLARAYADFLAHGGRTAAH